MSHETRPRTPVLGPHFLTSGCRYLGVAASFGVVLRVATFAPLDYRACRMWARRTVATGSKGGPGVHEAASVVLSAKRS